MSVETVSTTPFDGQKPGTSGLRKKTTVFQQEHYVENFVQATLDAAPDVRGGILVVGGDGRYFNADMIQTILRMCAANGVEKVVVGQHGLLSTPAVSALIRSLGARGGFILTASHNPGGPAEDCGLKYNVGNGGPAPESVTDAIYLNTTKISEYRTLAGSDDVNLAELGTTRIGDCMDVEVVDSTENYVELMKQVFDFEALERLLSRSDFSMVYDAMNGVAGPYARRIFHDMLGVPLDNLLNCEPLEDFGGGHPDPNLTYAADLVRLMGLDRTGSVVESAPAAYDFGAAADGDADRNMVLGKRFFVTPSDSLAILAANADAIPFFREAGGLKSIARSMPTSGAADLVADKQGLGMFQVPTGWKFFGNLMDADGDVYNPLICGEESFGTGSNHIREKDGIWAVLAWLSVLAHLNQDSGAPLVSVRDICVQHWETYGRSFYSRYDYENVDSAKAAVVMGRLTGMIDLFNKLPAEERKITLADDVVLVDCDEFEYRDPVDQSVSPHQGWRFHLEDGSRFVFRLSGTGSVGATIRLYLEKYLPPSEQGLAELPTAKALEQIVSAALGLSDLHALTGREGPTVIT